MEIVLGIRKERKIEWAHIEVDAIPRQGEYIAVLSEGGNTHDIYKVAGVVHSNAMLSTIIVDIACLDQDIVQFCRMV